MATTTTPYMSLVLPIPTLEPGPTWASELVTAFGVLDAHNHTSGSGVEIPSAGININADLNVNNYNFTNFRSTRYQDQGSALVQPTDLGCLYIAGGNLYYNNGTGVAIQITAGAALNAASIGGIGGDYGTSTASVYYTSAQTMFYFTQSSNTVAFISAGAYSFYENLLSGFATTLQCSPSIGASYTLDLPPALPTVQGVFAADSAGIGTFAEIDNSTVEINSNTLQVKDHGITQVKMAAMATGTSVAAGGIAISSSVNFSSTSGSLVDVTNATVTIVTTGRPVYVQVMPDPTAGTTAGYIELSGAVSNEQFVIAVFRGATQVGTHRISIANDSTNNEISYPPTSVQFIDVVAAGTYTYKLQIQQITGGTIAFVNCVLVAYEI